MWHQLQTMASAGCWGRAAGTSRSAHNALHKSEGRTSRPFSGSHQQSGGTFPPSLCQSSGSFSSGFSGSLRGLPMLGVVQPRLFTLWSTSLKRSTSSGLLQGGFPDHRISLTQWLTLTSPIPSALSLCSCFFPALRACDSLVCLFTCSFLSPSLDSKAREGKDLVRPFHHRIPSV